MEIADWPHRQAFYRDPNDPSCCNYSWLPPLVVAEFEEPIALSGARKTAPGPKTAMLEAEIRWVDGVVIDSLRRTQVRSVREHSEHFASPGRS